MDKKQTDYEGNKGKKDGLSHKLLDELSAVSANDLPNADFFGPASGPGCREIHVIDAGNKEDKNGHSCKDIEVCYQASPTGIVKMYPDNRLETEN